MNETHHHCGRPVLTTPPPPTPLILAQANKHLLLRSPDDAQSRDVARVRVPPWAVASGAASIHGNPAATRALSSSALNCQQVLDWEADAYCSA